MNEHRYFAHVAEAAVSAGRPLGDDLDAACRAVHRTPRRVKLATEHAKDGALGLALERLRVDPLASAVALLEPRATSEAAARLREFPAPFELIGPVLVPLLYVALLAIVQISMALLMSFKVLPAIGRTAASGVLSAIAILLAGVVFAAAAALLATQARTASRGGIPALVLRELRVARLLAASAVLVRHGRAAPFAVTRLAGPAHVAEDDAAALLGSAELDAASLDTLADWLAGEGTRRARSLGVTLRTAGAGGLVAVGLLVLGIVYWSLGLAGFSAIEAGGW